MDDRLKTVIRILQSQAYPNDKAALDAVNCCIAILKLDNYNDPDARDILMRECFVADSIEEGGLVNIRRYKEDE